MPAVRKWLWVRLSFIVIGVLGGPESVSPDSVAASNVDWWACLFIVLVAPLGYLFVVGIQAFNPRSAATWRRPSWTANPFDFSEPLQFCHAAAFFFLASGVGAFASLPFHSWAGAPLATSLLSFGAGSWVGVWLCVWCFRHKMERDVP